MTVAAPSSRLARWDLRMGRAWLRKVFWFIVVLAFFVLLWEAYKFVWTGFGWEEPVRADNRSMPHTWDIVEALFRPVRRGTSEWLLVTLLEAALFTWRAAFAGFVVGTLFGFGLAVLFVRSSLLERGLMPYVVASQTIPLIAIAPMVVIWGGKLQDINLLLFQFSWKPWMSVAVISTYLTFFPVTINTLRGLRSPQATATELMRSYAASKNQVLWKLQVPAALPYIFSALKISATASVIGAVIGELPAGLGQGLGRALLNFNSTFSSAPEKLYGAVLMSAMLGIFFVSLVILAESLLLPANRRLAE